MINEVIDQVRDSFLDEGIDESVLSDLKMLWKRKLEESKALEEHKSPEQVRWRSFLNWMTRKVLE